jgi:hypothetical protein
MTDMFHSGRQSRPPPVADYRKTGARPAFATGIDAACRCRKARTVRKSGACVHSTRRVRGCRRSYRNRQHAAGCRSAGRREPSARAIATQIPCARVRACRRSYRTTARATDHDSCRQGTEPPRAEPPCRRGGSREPPIAPSALPALPRLPRPVRSTPHPPHGRLPGTPWQNHAPLRHPGSAACAPSTIPSPTSSSTP